MADYNSQLPVRSKDDADERVLIKIQDGSDPSGVDKTAEVSFNKLHTRVHGKDSDGTDREALMSQEGHVQSNGDYDATTNKRPSSQGLITSDRNATPSETTMNQRPTAVSGDNDKVAIDVAISDSDGNHFSASNPLPVYQAESPATEVEDYNEAVDVAKDASSNHDYTVSGGVSLSKIKAFGSGSGLARFELQIETGVGAGTFDTAMVKFNSTASPNVEFSYAKEVAGGVVVRLVKTNLDNQPQSLYSQIQGSEA